MEDTSHSPKATTSRIMMTTNVDSITLQDAISQNFEQLIIFKNSKEN